MWVGPAAIDTLHPILYVDARTTYVAGAVTMTATVAGSAGNGRVVTVPTDTTTPAVVAPTTAGAPSVPGQLPVTGGGDRSGLLLAAGAMLLVGGTTVALTRRKARG